MLSEPFTTRSVRRDSEPRCVLGMLRMSKSPVERDEGLDALVAVIDPVSVTHAHTKRLGEVEEVQVEDGLRAGGAVQLVADLSVIVEQISGDALDVGRLQNRQVGIEQRHFVRGGILGEVGAGKSVVAARKKDFAGKNVASVLSFVPVLQDQGMVRSEGGNGETPVCGHEVASVMAAEGRLSIVEADGLRPQRSHIAGATLALTREV